MPSDLGNLLIRVTSVGFDEVLQNLQDLESVMSRLGANSALGQISQQLDQMTRYLKDMHGDLGELVLQHDRHNDALTRSGQQVEETAKRYEVFGGVLSRLTKVGAAFWAAVSVPRKFLHTMEDVAAFNQSLTHMAMNAGISREKLAVLGNIIEGFGGSKEKVATVAGALSTAQIDVNNGGTIPKWMENLAGIYHINISGTDKSTLVTFDEFIERLREKFLNPGTTEQDKLGILKEIPGADSYFRDLLEMPEDKYAQAKENIKAYYEETKDAVAASNRLISSLKDIEQKWNIFQSKVLVGIEPYLDKLIKWGGEFLDMANKFAEKNPLLAAIIEITVSAGAAAAALKVLSGIFNGWGNGKVFGNGGIADGIQNNLPTGTNGGASTGKSGGGLVGASAQVVGAAAQVGEAVIVAEGIGEIIGKLNLIELSALQSKSTLETLETRFKGFLERYEKLNPVLKPASIDELDENDQLDLKATDESTKKLDDECKKIEDEIITLAKGLAEEVIKKIDVGTKNIDEECAYLDNKARNQASDIENKESKDGGNEKVTNITISNIEITVSSNSSEPTEVAKAVREELMAQINDAIYEATVGNALL